MVKIMWVIIRARNFVRFVVDAVRASKVVRQTIAVLRSAQVHEAARRAWPGVREFLRAVRDAWSGRVGGGAVAGMAAG